MANEKRQIDANVVLAKQFTAGLSDASGNYYGHADVVFVNDIENAPTVDAVEVVHSSWILNDDGSGTCKHCHRTTKSCWDFDNQMNYCPNCGAKMDLKGE